MTSSGVVRSDDLRKENHRRVLDTLRARGSCSPAGVSSATGLSAASISLLAKQLADQGIVQSLRLTPTQTSGSSRGRPQTSISLNANAGDIISLTLLLDRIRVQRVDYTGKVLLTHEQTIKSLSMSESALLHGCCNAIQDILRQDAGNEVKRIGVAVEGVVENKSGVLNRSPIIKPRNVNLGKRLQTRFKLPVSMFNNCHLVSEALSRQSSDTLGDSFATIVFSQGVGLGLFIDGAAVAGTRTSALELAHLRFERDGALCRCGQHGCIEAYAAGYGIERMAQDRSIHDTLEGAVSSQEIQALCEAAQGDDTAAMQAFAIAGAAVAEGLSVLFSLFDPMPVAMVGRDKDAIELMRCGIHSVFRNSSHGAVSDIDALLHCFDDEAPLLQSGLIHSTLSRLDKQFAYQSGGSSAAETLSRN